MSCRFSVALLFLVFAGTLACSAASWAQSEADVQRQEDAKQNAYFDKAHRALDSALEMFDEKNQLPGEKELAFYDFLSRTKESQQRKIETYLDAAAEALGISNMSERRNRIADLRTEIEELQSDISRFRLKKVSAPTRSYNPLTVTQSGFDKKIKNAEAKLETARQEIDREKSRLVKQLNDIGMKLDPESVDMLLESSTGDEFVRISIVFDNAKRMAKKLEELTEKSGEDLTSAKKYYGVYLMLLKTVERLQHQFVENVDQVYYPDINAYAERAQKNITQAEKAIELGGNREILERNIASNQLMYQAAMLYKESLSHQKHQMLMANLECKKNILTAANTYRTVELSKDVASLMAQSRRAFDAITSLSVPDLRPFENQKMKEAFQNMVRELKK